MKRLSECKENDTVTIKKIEGSGVTRKRLLDMGFMRGAKLKVVRYAPLKDPLEVLVIGTHISLRVSEAEKICVEELSSDQEKSGFQIKPAAKLDT